MFGFMSFLWWHYDAFYAWLRESLQCNVPETRLRRLWGPLPVFAVEYTEPLPDPVEPMVFTIPLWQLGQWISYGCSPFISLAAWTGSVVTSPFRLVSYIASIPAGWWQAHHDAADSLSSNPYTRILHADLARRSAETALAPTYSVGLTVVALLFGAPLKMVLPAGLWCLVTCTLGPLQALTS